MHQDEEHSETVRSTGDAIFSFICLTVAFVVMVLVLYAVS